MISYRVRPEKVCLPIMLPEDLTKTDAPIGTEVFLIEENYAVMK